MSYIDDYKKRVLKGATSLKEVHRNRAINTFDRYMQKSPTSQYYQVTDVDEPCITETTKSILVAINDIADNDKTALDEKDIYVDRNANVDVGCYIRYDNVDWLIVFKEYHSYDIKKHFIMRRCNNYMTVKYLGKLYKIPISVENLTMYSDGIADNIYLSYMDSKKQIWYGSSPVTRSIYENYRMLLTHRTAFRITHINDFEYNGLIKSLVLQTAVLKGDDFSTLLADNNARYSSENNKEVESPKYPDINKIIGEKKISFGEELEYTIKKSSGNKTIVWKIDNDLLATIISFSDENVVIRATLDFKQMGKKFKLKVKNEETQKIIDEIEISIRR